MAHAELSRDPDIHQKKPLYLTHLKFENRSRTTCSRFLRSFAVPDKAVALELSSGKLRGVCCAPTHTHANTHAHQHSHTTRQDKTRQDKTRQDKTRQDKTRQDKTRQDKTRRDETRRDETRRDETRRDETRRRERRREKREERERERETFSNTRANAFLFWENSSPTCPSTPSDLPWCALPFSPIVLSALPPSSNPKTIQYLISGRTTNVESLKQVKNWQSPSRDPWSNWLINSRETTKGQTNYYSGRQKDNSKTICGSAGYHFFSDTRPRNDQRPALLACRETSLAFDSHSTLLSLDPHEMSLNIDMKMILPVKFSDVSSNLNSNSFDFLTELQRVESWKIFHSNSIGSPSSLSKALYSWEVLNHSNLCSHAVFDCVLVYLTKTQYRIWKDVDLCALKTDDLFITNQRQLFPWILSPVNIVQTIDLILFGHQFRRNVEHLYHCQIFCILDGMPIVWAILHHEYSWFQCYRHEHFPYHRMFSPSFVTFIEDRFCFSALDHSPYPRMFWILRINPILFRRLQWWIAVAVLLVEGKQRVSQFHRDFFFFQNDVLVFMRET